jgi:hypothetical protein
MSGQERSRRLFIAIEANHTRLWLTRLLSSHWTITTWDPATALTRAVRASGADVVLLGVRRRHAHRALAAARGIRTEGKHPPRVGLVDPRGALRDGPAAAARGDIDGLMVGKPDDEGAQDWVDAVAAGGRPILTQPTGGLIDRLRSALARQ